jgi:Domain of unknown function (DUF4258)
MSETLRRVQTLVASGRVRISDHGYDELANDDILAGEAVEGLSTAIALEEYPERERGLSVLTLQQDSVGRPIHVVWGIPKVNQTIAVLVTAYRPDPGLWDSELKQRKKI